MAEFEPCIGDEGRSGTTPMIDARPIIATLCQKFPAAFFMFEQRRKPLKLGIHRDILTALPTLSVKEIGAAMRVYAGNAFYCWSCVEGAARIDLDGNAVGTVTAEEAASSAARLAGIRKWKKQKAAAKKAAAETIARAKAEALAVARAAEIEAARPVPKGINAGKPTLTLGAIRTESRP